MRSIQWMLLGISIILIGGFLMLDPSSNMNGFYFFVFLGGFVVTLAGFVNSKDK
ncbi:hypothetical protein [Sporosarcina luteola]|uniref:hypothetical protein n=1 Tax=Sporosarcina luteola TaxID=582850 RepID=UPI002041FC69|nr:hypothetical protein [Sporosarcina luteola]MCM3711767.1 hypothetical protein [Sporosarcina luteola]